MDSGNFKLIPLSEGVKGDKNIETIYQPPDSLLLFKISKKNEEEDARDARDNLNEIIMAELRKTGNHGDSFDQQTKIV